MYHQSNQECKKVLIFHGNHESYNKLSKDLEEYDNLIVGSEKEYDQLINKSDEILIEDNVESDIFKDNKQKQK